MKHKRIASALLAAIIIITSASNSSFPVSAKDLDVQDQEVAESSADENEALPEEDTEQKDSEENAVAESGQESSDSTESGSSEPAQDVTADTENVAEDENVPTEDATVEENTQEVTEGTTQAATANYFDRYSWNPSGGVATQAADDIDVTAKIRKRTEWTNKDTGEAQVTLEYASTSGQKSELKNMNVVLVQDKSGSMDSNYGYNLECVRKGWSTPGEGDTVYYPLRLMPNGQKYTENLETYIKPTYKDRASYESVYNYNFTEPVGNKNYTGFRSGWLTNSEMQYNSPCQLKDHYYLLVQDDTKSGIPAWTMVSGRHLYNISSTDLHHYRLLGSDEDYHALLAQNRRIIKINKGEKYYSENGIQTAETDLCFVDETQLVRHNGTWILSTCGDADCQQSNRLSKSQEFMDAIVDCISKNPNNQIAYVPFWGDVPDENGNWANASSNRNFTDLQPETGNDRLTHKDGVKAIGFTKDTSVIKNQINDPFTYDGTNWSRALQKAEDILGTLSPQDREKDTLVIFLTDGEPQGTAGKQDDYKNPKINGKAEAARLKENFNAQIYVCGVGVALANASTIADRFADTFGYNVSADTKDPVFFARTTDDFDDLKNAVIKRLEEDYKVEVKGENAFYKDVIDDTKFTIDETKLATDSTWIILDKESETLNHGVPQNVYYAFEHWKKYIYVRDTHTVYWAIGTLDPNVYEADGHKMTFPVKYKDYANATDGDIELTSNTEQKLTYNTSLGDYRSEEMDSPKIIFNRSLASVTITKNVTGANFTEDKTFRFAYTTAKQTGAKVQDSLGTVEVTVPQGAASGTGTITGLRAGTYYVYEVDENNQIISSEVPTITVTESAQITTEDRTKQPASATSSQYEQLLNSNNVLRVTTQGNDISFTNEYVKVNVTKAWSDEGYTQRPESVTIRLLRNGTEINTLQLSAANNWQGSFENLEKKDAKGKEYLYTIKEDVIPGYDTDISDPTTDTAGNASYTVTNTLVRGSITIQKKDGDGHDLAGAVFELKNKAGDVVGTATSGDDGKVEFRELLPDTYTVTETKTASGYMLLKDPVTVTIPMKLTQQEVKDQKVDTSKCKKYTENGETSYWIYDFTYEISNGKAFSIPFAGGEINGQMYVPLIAGMLLLCVAAALLFRKRKSMNK